MIEKTTSVHWEGPGKKGKGQVSIETGALERYPYGFATGKVDTQSRVRLSSQGEGFVIDRIALTLNAAVAEISPQATLEAGAS